MKRLDLTGQVYGKLTANNYTRSNPKNNMSYWLCTCECGKQIEVSLGNLRSGHTKSCGCAKPSGDKCYNYKHGYAQQHKVYKAWCKIKERCFNPNDKSYSTYGAIGITMCEDFKNDFISFYNEIGDPPTDLHSVDRIDRTKNYEKGNIRWATSHQQARNKGKMSNNSSGFTGVHWENKLHPDGVSCTTYAVAQWKEYQDGVMHFKKKSFSIKKYGFLEAFAMACSFREQQIKRLNTMGYGYSDNHGI